MRETGCAGEPLAVDRLDDNGLRALAGLGVEVIGPTPATRRRARGQDAAMADFEAAARPGIREHELMAVLNESLLRLHGELMFTRVIAAGANTNPWMSEAHDKLVQPGDLVGPTPTRTSSRATSSTSRAPSCAETGRRKARRRRTASPTTA